MDDQAKYLRDCTAIYPEQIEEEFVRTPSDVAYWNAQYADALDVFLKAEAHRKREWARLYLLKKAEASAAEERTTETSLKAVVEASDEYAEAVQAEILAEAQKERMRGHVDAVHTKRDMLQSLGAKLRVEMMSDPQVRQRERQLSGRE